MQDRQIILNQKKARETSFLQRGAYSGCGMGAMDITINGIEQFPIYDNNSFANQYPLCDKVRIQQHRIQHNFCLSPQYYEYKVNLVGGARIGLIGDHKHACSFFREYTMRN